MVVAAVGNLFFDHKPLVSIGILALGVLVAILAYLTRGDFDAKGS